MRRSISKICKNCKLFDLNKSECSILILHEGKKIRLPVDANDSCFYEGEYFDPISNIQENFAHDVKQVRIWVEDEKGEKTNENGTVKIEYPEGFFGENIDSLLS